MVTGPAGAREHSLSHPFCHAGGWPAHCQGFASEQASPLPPLPIQYADYAVWQRQWLQGEILETQLAYWVSQLGGNTPLRLPVDHPRPEGMSYRGAHYVFAFPADLSEAIA